MSRKTLIFARLAAVLSLSAACVSYAYLSNVEEDVHPMWIWLFFVGGALVVIDIFVRQERARSATTFWAPVLLGAVSAAPFEWHMPDWSPDVFVVSSAILLFGIKVFRWRMSPAWENVAIALYGLILGVLVSEHAFPMTP
jgi:hypothetical protein